MCDQHPAATPVTHPWAEIGLGIAPFECEQVLYLEDHRNPPCALGACSVCGTKLKYNYIIKDAAGDHFTVGSECVLILENTTSGSWRM